MHKMAYLSKVFCGNYRHNPLILCEDVAVFAIHSNRIHLEEREEKGSGVGGIT